jgi:hypothetical protein
MRRAFSKEPPSDKFFDMVQIRTFFSGKKTEIAHLDEASGQNVLEESTDEFLCRERASLVLITHKG